MNALITALRDGAFSRSVLNFTISVCTLLILYGVFFAPRHIPAHVLIANFIEWTGLVSVAHWLDTKLFATAADNSDLMTGMGLIIIISSAAFQGLQGGMPNPLPSQPAYGALLGGCLMVDFGGAAIWVAVISIVLALSVALTLNVLSENSLADWSDVLVYGAFAPMLAIFSAPFTLLAFIAVGSSSSRPLKINVETSAYNPIYTESAKKSRDNHGAAIRPTLPL